MQTATETSGASQAETTQPGQLVERAAKYLTANLGPLPSDFAPPTDCGSLSLVYYGHTSYTTYVTIGWGVECDGNNERWRNKSSCYPPRYGPALQALEAIAVEDAAIYPLFSPASICPAGFYPACSFGPVSTGAEKISATGTTAVFNALTITRGMSNIIKNILEPKQSAVGCCPTGYSCVNSRPYICLASASTSVVSAWANGCPANPTKAVLMDMGGRNREVWSSAALLLLVRDNTQSQANAGPSVPVSGTASGSGTAPSTSSGAGEVAAASDGDSGGLSTGAKAAIGASVPLAAIVIGLALFFFFRRRSRRRDESSAAAAGAAAGATQPADDSTKEAASAADYDPRQSGKLSQPVSALTSPVPDRAQTVSPAVSVAYVSELYGSVAKPVRLHEDIMELPGEVVNAPDARRPVSEAP